ncbi:MAG: glucose-1-phosphate adenylyltransferase [Planctomycetota bacterium]
MPGNPRTLTFVLAGGAGERLQPLTRERAKPAVPFGARYRIIDFVLSNLWNSGLRSVYVLTQYKSQSLLDHIHSAWQIPRGLDKDQFVVAVPAQMRTGESWFQGTADAVFQNWALVEEYDPDIVAVFGADHIYKMDVKQMVDYHREKNALATVTCLPVPLAETRHFGVVSTDDKGRIMSFLEKPPSDKAPPMPGKPDKALASMGNYTFDALFLRDLLEQNADHTSHDFGKDILPQIAGRGRLFSYDFNTNRVPGAGEVQYWRDVGTIDAYYDASLDLKSVTPQLDLYNRLWPIRSASSGAAPTKFVFDEDGRRGMAIQSIVGGGTIVAGGYVKDSVVGRNCFIDAGADVRDSVLFDNVRIGRGARVRRAIIDKNFQLGDGDRIGYDAEYDRRRFTVSETGIIVVPRARDHRVGDRSGSQPRLRRMGDKP